MWWLGGPMAMLLLSAAAAAMAEAPFKFERPVLIGESPPGATDAAVETMTESDLLKTIEEASNHFFPVVLQSVIFRTWRIISDQINQSAVALITNIFVKRSGSTNPL